ncbi:hypothetical protein Dimus_019872 [Dionaea muscipula]
MPVSEIGLSMCSHRIWESASVSIALDFNMADLENLLLEAAGRPAGSGRDKYSHQSSRSQRHTTYLDDDSDSKDDDSDDGQGYAGRKPSRTQVPLKKRSKGEGVSKASDDDNSGFDHEIDSSDDSDVGSDLYKDEDDRQQLAKMTELNRELILHDRATKRDDKKLHKRIKSRWESEKKVRPLKETSAAAAAACGVRTSARFVDKTPAKSNALNELKARRMRRESDAREKVLTDVSTAGPPMKRKKLATSSPYRSDIGSEFHSEDDESTGDGRMDYSDDDEKGRAENEIPTFEEITSITIRRSKLAKWLMEPFFDDLMIGCFVRVGIGMKSGQNVYRLCVVQRVDLCEADRQYQLENKTTCKYLNCVWGSETSAARWQMARVSDSLPSEEEFDQWIREVERTSSPMPSRKEVLEKKEEIDKAVSNCVYNAAIVKQMLEEKKAVTTRPLNIAAEKEKLRREMEAAQERHNDAEIERIKAKLRELEAVRQERGKDQKALKLAEMNRKNRAENFRVLSVSKPVSTGLKAGDVGYDPFSRRWTRSTNYYVAKPEGGVGATASAEGCADGGGSNLESNNASMATTAAAIKAAAGAGKLVDTSAPVDQGTASNFLHNFELPISLASLPKLDEFKAAYEAAYLARKQRIEASMVLQLPEDDGRTHSLTLTLADYKRRRGLL